MTIIRNTKAIIIQSEDKHMKKTISFAIIHMSVAFTIGYTMSGDIWVGGALALIEPLCNTVAFYFHEKIWLRINQASPSEKMMPI